MSLLERLVFFGESQEQRGDADFGRRRWVLGSLVALATMAVGWWLFVPPIVHRPAAPVWCPAASPEQPAGRFDARAVLGTEVSDGEELAARHGCVVRVRGGSMTAERRINRISVDVSRGKIIRVFGIE